MRVERRFAHGAPRLHKGDHALTTVDAEDLHDTVVIDVGGGEGRVPREAVGGGTEDLLGAIAGDWRMPVAALAVATDKVVILRGDREIVYGEAVFVLDQAQIAGAEGFALATPKAKGAE